MPTLKYRINGQWVELSGGSAGSEVVVDSTLSTAGAAAEAKATGEAIKAINDSIADVATQEYVNEAVNPIIEFASGLEGQIAEKQNKVIFNTSQPANWSDGDIWLKPAE